MLRCILFAVVAVCCLTSCALTKALKTGKHLSKASTENADSYTFTVPFEIKTGHLQLPVNINGSDYLFYLDTGAPTAVSPQLARSLHPKSINNKSGIARNAPDTLVTIDRMKIGDARYKNIGGILFNSGDLLKRSCVPVNGLVGANVMNNNVWQIDYVNKRFVIADKTENLSHIADAVSIPFHTAPFTKTPILILTLDNGKTVRLVYDTGFNGYATLTTDSASQFLHGFQPERVTKSLSEGYASVLGDSVAKAIDTTFIIQTNIRSGNDTLGNVPVTFGRYKNYSESKNGVIGNEFFKNCIVTLDWSKKTMYVYAAKPVEKIYKTWGMAYGMIDDKLIIGSIVPGMEPDRLGVSIGDEIVEVNGIKISTLTRQQRCEYIDGSFVLVSEERGTSMFTIRKQSGEILQATFSRH